MKDLGKIWGTEKAFDWLHMKFSAMGSSLRKKGYVLGALQ